MRVVGLDLSLTATGIARCDGSTHCVKPKTMGIDRLADIRQAIYANLTDVSLVALEGYSYGSKGRSLFQIGELGGVIRYMLWEQEVPYVEIPPTVLKKYATGKGTADKDAMLAAAIRRLDYQGSNNNEADALFLRHAGLHWYGHGEYTLPAAHFEALKKIDWPILDDEPLTLGNCS